MSNSVVISDYWKKRKGSIYLYAAKKICERYGKEAYTYVDVGSNGTPIIEWHRKRARKMVSVDLRKPYIADGVESIKTNFFEFNPGFEFDMATCFQVLEHVSQPQEFAQKLLQISKVLVVSVPYQWESGRNKTHIQDPVDEEKMLGWFGRIPDFGYLATELNGVKRLIQVYKKK